MTKLIATHLHTYRRHSHRCPVATLPTRRPCPDPHRSVSRDPRTGRAGALCRGGGVSDLLHGLSLRPGQLGRPARQREIQAVRDSLSYQATKLSEGLLSGTSDETIGQATGGATDFLTIGELRDLANQGNNLGKGVSA